MALRKISQSLEGDCWLLRAKEVTSQYRNPSTIEHFLQAIYTLVILKYMSITSLKKHLRTLATEERAQVNAWFFKTGKGQYGEGNKFIGVTVPDARSVAKVYKDLLLSEIETLLASKIHEERFVAL